MRKASGITNVVLEVFMVCPSLYLIKRLGNVGAFAGCFRKVVFQIPGKPWKNAN
jgi:hypothetical protein